MTWSSVSLFGIVFLDDLFRNTKKLLEESTSKRKTEGGAQNKAKKVKIDAAAGAEEDDDDDSDDDFDLEEDDDDDDDSDLGEEEEDDSEDDDEDAEGKSLFTSLGVTYEFLEKLSMLYCFRGRNSNESSIKTEGRRPEASSKEAK